MNELKIQRLADWDVAFFDPYTMNIYINEKYLNDKNYKDILTHETKHLLHFKSNPKWLAYLKSFWMDDFDGREAKRAMDVYNTIPKKKRLTIDLWNFLTLGMIHFLVKMDDKWYFQSIFFKVRIR